MMEIVLCEICRFEWKESFLVGFTGGNVVYGLIMFCVAHTEYNYL